MAREIICDSCGEHGEQKTVPGTEDHMQVILRLGGPHGDTRDEIKIDLCAVCRKQLKSLAELAKSGQRNLREEKL